MGGAGDQATLNQLNGTKNDFVMEAERQGARAEGLRREVVGLGLVVDATNLEVSRLTEAILRLQAPNVPDPLVAERIAVLTQLRDGHQARLPIVAEEIATATSNAEAFQAAADAANNSAAETRVLIVECLKTMGM